MAMKSAFCCASLRTGALIIGWLFLVLTVLNCIITLSRFEYRYPTAEERDADFGNQTFDSPTYDKKIKIPGIIIVSVGLTLLAVATLGLLLYGTYKEKPFFLLPFLFVYGAGAALSGVHFILMSYIAIEDPVPIVQHLIMIAPIVISVYCVCVIWSYYKQLRSENDDPKHRV